MAERIASERNVSTLLLSELKRLYQIPSAKLLKMIGQEPLGVSEKELNIIGREMA
jgi:hypothetical protein